MRCGAPQETFQEGEMTVTRRVGETTTNRCPRCERVVESHFELRTVQLAHSRLRVPGVLVDVCPHCDHMISIAPQSLPQLREAGVPK